MKVWKEVDGFPNYQVSNRGDVRSNNPHFKKRKENFLLTPWRTEGGYQVVQLFDGKDRRRCTTVSRLVAQAFVPNPENKPQVNHKNGNKLDNFYLNLEWVTDSENKLHAYHYGLMKGRGGEQCHFSRFTEQDVLEIRKTYNKNPEMSYAEIGKKFNASGSTVGKIILRQRWKYI